MKERRKEPECGRSLRLFAALPLWIGQLERCHRKLNQRFSRKEATNAVGGELQKRTAASGQVLLVADVLIGRDEQIEFGFGLAQEITVLDATPAALPGRHADMSGENLVHGPRDAFVQQDFHAAVGERRADSELSRMRQAISRVTEGKHSRHSSKL